MQSCRYRREITTMRKAIGILGIITLSLILFTGCSSSGDKENKKDTILETITAKQAKEIMDQNKEVIILDVRTEEEYNSGHIKGAILIPEPEITAKAGELLTDKEATLLVYCRSGRRSALAASALQELGYSTIYDFGGILDWPYEIVTDEIQQKNSTHSP